MKRYPKERKEAILAKLCGPDRKNVPQVAEEEGVSVATLYAWRGKARAEGRLMPSATMARRAGRPETSSPQC